MNDGDGGSAGMEYGWIFVYLDSVDNEALFLLELQIYIGKRRIYDLFAFLNKKAKFRIFALRAIRRVKFYNKSCSLQKKLIQCVTLYNI